MANSNHNLRGLIDIEKLIIWCIVMIHCDEALEEINQHHFFARHMNDG